jgi:hypothetical protein
VEQGENNMSKTKRLILSCTPITRTTGVSLVVSFILQLLKDGKVWRYSKTKDFIKFFCKFKRGKITEDFINKKRPVIKQAYLIFNFRPTCRK